MSKATPWAEAIFKNSYNWIKLKQEARKELGVEENTEEVMDLVKKRFVLVNKEMLTSKE